MEKEKEERNRTASETVTGGNEKRAPKRRKGGRKVNEAYFGAESKNEETKRKTTMRTK